MESIRKNGWLIFLLFILLWIGITTIKPQFYLMGFDNYSSYFNQGNILFRTLFSAWRNHWSLGVASDSEIVDLPRQAISLFLNLFLPLQVVDQVYVFMTLVFGAVGMFLLGKLLYKKYLSKISKDNWANLFGFIAAFFYIFNLNTLAIYYFIIITYNNRFFTLPWLFYIFFTLLGQQKISLRKYLFFVIVLIFSSGSYITGTILITTCMSLGLASVIFITKSGFKKLFLFYLIFFTINAFWITPFMNYTREKSGIIKHAPTFIDANELQLNQPAEVYNLGEQVILRPNFFDSIVSTNDGRQFPWHPLADLYKSSFYYPILLIFPVLYFLGSLIILIRFKKLYKLLWLPFIILIFLFLSMKDFSPLGGIYSFFDKNIPYFGVLFRFGDTKFHPYIAFAGSIASAVAIVQLFQLVPKSKIRKEALASVMTVLVMLTLFVFRWYFIGQFIGYFLYNKMPDAYFKIANTINQDSKENRVLHLPLEKHGYWKSYSWGYIGSSFFHYFIDKPFIDRTFEPASMENAYLHQKLYAMMSNMQASQSNGNPSNRVYELYSLLRSVGVEYIIYDSTVQSEQVSRGLTYWGDYNSPDVKTALDLLEKKGLVTVVSSYNVNPADYIDDYKRFIYPPREIGNKSSKEQNIILYKLIESAQRIDFLPALTQVDPSFETILDSSKLNSEHIIQEDGVVGQLYPFADRSSHIIFNDNDITIQSKSKLVPNRNYSVYYSKDNDLTGERRMLDVRILYDGKNFVIKVYNVNAPKIGENSFETLIGSTTVDPSLIEDSAWKIAVDGLVLQPPTSIGASETSIGHIITSSSDTKVQILSKTYSTTFDPGIFSFTEQPNCFNDKLEGYEFSAQKLPDGITVHSQNGSTCFWRGIEDVIQKSTSPTNYFEVRMELEGSESSLDKDYGYEPNSVSKPGLYNYVTSLEKPNLLRICIKEALIDECLNSQEMRLVGDREIITVPLKKSLSETQEVVMLVSLMNNGYQKQDVTIHQMQLDSYSEVQSKVLDYIPNTDFESHFVVRGSESVPLTITIPNAISPYSSFKNETQAYYISTGPCEEANGYRTFRIVNGQWLNYMKSCHNQLFTRLPFNSNHFYLIGFEYNLYAGKYPKFILDDGFYDYADEYLSLYLGYPDIPEFKSLSLPERSDSIDYSQLFKDMPYVTTYTWLPAESYVFDAKQKQFTLHQDSLNEAGYLLGAFTIAELPSKWQNLIVEPESVYHTYALPDEYTIRKLLPSLWKTEIQTSNVEGDFELIFREGYDRQWIVSESLIGAVFGRDIAKKHGRCDGYANCFELSKELFKTNSSKTLYIYYLPQTLAFIGWIISLGGIIGGWFLYKKVISSQANNSFESRTEHPSRN